MRELLDKKVTVAFMGDKVQVTAGILESIEDGWLYINMNNKENKFKLAIIPMNKIVSIFVYKD